MADVAGDVDYVNALREKHQELWKARTIAVLDSKNWKISYILELKRIGCLFRLNYC